MKMKIIAAILMLSILACGCRQDNQSGQVESETEVSSQSNVQEHTPQPVSDPARLIGNLLLNEPFTLSDFPVEETKANLEKAKDACMPVLSALDTPQGENYMPENKDYEAMQENVAAMGFAVSEFPWGIINYQQVLDFCGSVKAGEDAVVAVYDIRNTMVFAEVFVTRNGRVGNITVYQDFPNPNIEPSDEPVSVSGPEELDRFEFTEKGYLLYHYSSWDGGCRVLPLDGEKRSLTEKYALYFDTFNNIMLVDWDENNLDKLNMLYVFECFYNLSGRRATDDFPRTDISSDGKEEFLFALPADIVEETLTKHMPVTVEYLRSMPDYDASLNVYNWRIEPRGGVPPFPEAVDLRENSDGSLTITFDAIPDNQSSDRLYSSTMTVKDNPDGSIKYLSNKTDYDTVYPYNHLRGLPLINIPAAEKDKAAYEAGGEAYRKFCTAISAYFLTHSPDHMRYPGTSDDILSELRFVSYMFETGVVTPGFDYKACLNAAGNTYAYPRDEMLEYLQAFFPNAQDTSRRYVTDYLTRHGILDADRGVYLVPAGDYSYDGSYEFAWIGDNEDGTTSFNVIYSKDGNIDYSRQFSFTIDFRQEPFRFLEVRP